MNKINRIRQKNLGESQVLKNSTRLRKYLITNKDSSQLKFLANHSKHFEASLNRSKTSVFDITRIFSAVIATIITNPRRFDSVPIKSRSPRHRRLRKFQGSPFRVGNFARAISTFPILSTSGRFPRVVVTFPRASES